jgi:uncharacterized phage protein (TIGR01671 family)
MENRELKFRAWNTQENKMLFRRFFEMNWYETPTNDEKGCHTWGAISGGQSRFLKIMQSTCLKDKNGKEIYEGDIIKFRSHPASMETAQVIFDEVSARFMASYDGGWHSFQHYNHLEVIGNIYQNPELLK